MEDTKSREQISAQFKWRLEDIYANDALWEQDMVLASEKISVVASFAGKLDSETALLDACRSIEQASILVEKLFCYAKMRCDEDNANPFYQALADRAMQKRIERETLSAYFAPELFSLGQERIQEYLLQCKELAPYARSIGKILRMEAHTLSPELEEMLAQVSDLANAPDNIYSMLTDADFTFGTVPDGEGKQVQLTQGRYIALMENADRNVRKAAYEALYKQYKAYINTISATYAASVKKDVFFAKARKYASTRQATLDQSEIPVAVYDALIEAVHRHLPAMHRYLALRKKLLKLDTLHYYDIYVPIVPGVQMGMPFDDALRTVIESLAPLGNQYTADVACALKQGWIDVYENTGKTSGAYSWGPYDVHPYVLLNYSDTLGDLFTLAHELGHAMHSFYSNKNQPYVQASYPLFLAEIASTTNEVIVMDSLMKKTQDPAQLIALCNYQLEQVRGAVFRQTLFAEFEHIVHERAMADEALTAQMLTDIYRDLNNLYYQGTEMDEEIAYEWTRIPHFYNAFYVYQYATGYSAAVAFSHDILSGDPQKCEKYLGFLAAGDAQPALDILREAGVDIESPQPVEQCLLAFEETLSRFEKLLEVVK